jgi:hypothetical protein
MANEIVYVVVGILLLAAGSGRGDQLTMVGLCVAVAAVARQPRQLSAAPQMIKPAAPAEKQQASSADPGPFFD